ncbi:MAG: DUF4178 domain-containing protein, partial [Thermoanaerobaculia bacterium]
MVCEYCRSIVARTDQGGVESHGKVAALIDTGSPLRIHNSGKYRGVGFRITGRTQMRHQAGGMWDEWYAAFDDGRWGWLAEAQGRFYVTFKVESNAPPLEMLELGGPAPFLSDFFVAEIGTGKLIAAEGELPWVPEPGHEYQYVDLTGPEQRFATIDYSEDPPVVFKGSEATLAELGLEDLSARPGKRIQATALNCPQCGGALDLKAPDQAERIWCPNCGSGLDVTAGKLQYLKKLKKKNIKIWVPLGSTGTVDGDQYVVAGFMERAVTFDQTYYWTEYLLYNKEKGYRWLVHSDDHWSFVTPLRPGEVTDANPEGAPKNVYYGGKQYRLFQNATAWVSYVVGEFYWKVEQGEAVDTADYIAPPFGISKELTKTGAREIAYSHARYMTPKEVEAAFNVQDLPRPRTVGPMQPFTGAKLGRTWLLLTILLIVAACVLSAMLPRKEILAQTFDLASVPAVEGAPDNARVLFSEPFELSGKHNVAIAGASPVQNTWTFVNGDMVNEATGVMRAFELPLEYYSGVDQGEAWSEGKRERNVYMSRPEPGRYVLRLEAQWEQGKMPAELRVVVREGVFRWPYFILAF